MIPFGELLKSYRLNKNWTVVYISGKMDIPYKTWVNWEKELRTPPLYTQIMVMEKIERIWKENK